MGNLIQKINYYEKLLKEVLTASEKYLGMVSVKLLVERVVWDLSKEFRDIELLSYDENGISLENFLANQESISDQLIDEMFTKFISHYVEILAKLIGQEQAEKIIKKLSLEMENISVEKNEEGK